MQTKVQTPIRQFPEDYPHDSCDWPEDMIMAAKPSQLKARLEARGHKVTENGNGTYHKVKHQVLPVSVDYFITTGDKPYRVSDRARILRALKLFSFFVLLLGVAVAVLFWRQLSAFAAGIIL